MKREEEAVYIKVFDHEKGDVVFEGKVATDVEPNEVVKLRCFWERGLCGIYSKESNEQVLSFKGLQNNVKLMAGWCTSEEFSGVLYVGADDGVVRTSQSVPSSCECKMMSLWNLAHEECEKVFKCETLEELEIKNCKLMQIPTEMGGMKGLKKLTLYQLKELKSIPEEMGELSNLEVLSIEDCGVESLPKRLKELSMLKSICLVWVSSLQMNADDLIVFSMLKHLEIKWCNKVLTPPLSQLFWQMIKSTTQLRVLDLDDWYDKNREMEAAALEERLLMVLRDFRIVS